MLLQTFRGEFCQDYKAITALTRKSAVFNWSTECENSFSLLKSKLLSTPILKYPDFDKPFKIIVDASNFACGGILTQNYDGIDMPITYISKSFKKGELNKPSIEKELLAVHFAITKLRPYIYGKRFIVKSDHKPIVYLYNLKNPSSRLSRIRLDLEEYDFEIQNVRGKDNVIADALSRITINDLKELQEDTNVLAITRSKARNNSHIEPIALNVGENLGKLHVFEDFDMGFHKKIPKIRTKKISLNRVTKSVCGISIVAYKAHRKIFELKLANGGACLKSLFENLQKAASVHKFSQLQLRAHYY